MKPRCWKFPYTDHKMCPLSKLPTRGLFLARFGHQGQSKSRHPFSRNSHRRADCRHGHGFLEKAYLSYLNRFYFHDVWQRFWFCVWASRTMNI